MSTIYRPYFERLHPGFSPMLACKDFNEDKLRYPIATVRKFDGVRCILDIKQEVAISRSGHLVPNICVQRTLQRIASRLSNSVTLLDGEIVLDVHNDVDTQTETEGFMNSDDKELDFSYILFDIVYGHKFYEPYVDRLNGLHDMATNGLFDDSVVTLPHVAFCQSLRNVQEEYNPTYEGLVLRAPAGKYKWGRSTMKDQYMVKYVPWHEDTATVIGFREERDMFARGAAKNIRNGLGKGRLGSIECTCPTFEDTFFVSGFTDSLRDYIWSNKHLYMNTTIAFKYRKKIKTRPRSAIFLKFL